MIIEERKALMAWYLLEHDLTIEVQQPKQNILFLVKRDSITFQIPSENVVGWTRCWNPHISPTFGPDRQLLSFKYISVWGPRGKFKVMSMAPEEKMRDFALKVRRIFQFPKCAEVEICSSNPRCIVRHAERSNKSLSEYGITPKHSYCGRAHTVCRRRS